MLAAVVADIVAAALLRESLMTEKLARRGLKVQTEYAVDVLGTTLVRDVMTTEVDTLPATATVGDARRKIAAGRHGAYPILDDGRCVGIVARGDLLLREAGEEEPVAAVASRDLVTVGPEDTVLRALERMLQEEVDHLLVVAPDGHLQGICTRTDVFKARRRQWELERRQPGWRPLLKREGTNL